MFGLDLFQVVVAFLIVIAVILSILAFCLDYLREPAPRPSGCEWLWSQAKSLVSLDSIWVMLIVLLMLYLSAAGSIVFIRGGEALDDYLAFSAPCAAAVLVGIGLMERLSRKLKKAKANTSKYIDDSDLRWYFVSLILLYVGFGGYLWSHFSVMLFSYTATAFVIICLLAYFFIFTRRDWDRREARVEVASPLVGSILGVLALACLAFVVAYHDELRREEPQCTQCCKYDNNQAPNPKGGQY